MRYIVNFIAALSLLWGGCDAPKIPSAQVLSAATHQQASADQDGKYENVISGRAETADGAPFSFQAYKSPDGVSISTRLERRGTPARAEKELLNYIEAAVEVLERAPKLDEDGKRVGERAVLTTHQEGSTKLQTVVLWTDGPQLYFIESPSLPHALEFENWYLHNP